jgi:hypothetical protein
MWLAVGVSTELNDRVELEVAQHLRFDQDVSRVAAVMPEAGIDVDVTKFLALGAGYRYEYERQGMEFAGGHRLHVDARVKSRIVGPLELGYRTRVQDRVGESGKVRWRNRVELELGGFRGWKPAASVELFHGVEDGSLEHRKTRYALGLEFEKWERDVQTYYRVDASSDPMDPTMHIIGLELGMEL